MLNSISIKTLKRSLKHIEDILLSNGSIAKISYATLGDHKKPYLVMCHGASMNLFGWDGKFLKYLLSHFTLFLYDYPGLTGLSDLTGSNDYSVMIQAEALNVALSKLNISPAAVLGYSMGGWIAHAYAATYNVKHLILMATDAGGIVERPADTYFQLWKNMDSANTIKQGMTAFNMTFSHLSFFQRLALLVRFAVSTKIGRPRDQEISSRENMLYEKRYNQPNSNVPHQANTLVMSAGKDDIVPRRDPDDLRKQLPNSALCHFPDAGHGLPYQYPRETAKRIIHHITEYA